MGNVSSTSRIITDTTPPTNVRPKPIVDSGGKPLKVETPKANPKGDKLAKALKFGKFARPLQRDPEQSTMERVQ